MRCISFRHGVVATIAAGFLVLAPVASAHELSPWQTYPANGGVRIKTKSFRLLHEAGVQTLGFMQSGTSDARSGFFGFSLTPKIAVLAGSVQIVSASSNAKGASGKGKLSSTPAQMASWQTTVAGLLQQAVEAKGDPVASVTLEELAWKGDAKFKTKPSPLGPYYKVSVNIDITWRATVALQNGRTKKGKVTATVQTKGLIPPF